VTAGTIASAWTKLAMPIVGAAMPRLDQRKESF
jgi:hypothetical protein